MKTRTIALILGIALAVSVAVNLFAATAAFGVIRSHNAFERPVAGAEDRSRRPGPRELVAALSPEARDPVRRALREAGLNARPDFQAARAARREAVTLAAAPTYEPARVEDALARARAAETRGRARLEADTLDILATLSPADRAAFARILDTRGKGGDGRARDRDRNRRDGPAPKA